MIPGSPLLNAEFPALLEAKNYRRALISEFRPYLSGKVLEVGAGIGQLSAGLLQEKEVTELLAVEPDEVFCEIFRERHPSQPIFNGTVADIDTNSFWNALVSVNVLEHIKDDRGELSHYVRLLTNFGQRKNGYLCLFVPARPEIYAPIDRDFGHCRRYTKGDLQEKLETAGFEIVQMSYYNFPGYFAWWLSFCVLGKRRLGGGAVWLFDRLIFPPTHWLEKHLCRPPIGQNLLVIAQPR